MVTAGGEENIVAAGRATGPGAEAWRRLRRSPVAVLCGVYIVVLVVIAVLASRIAPYGYDAPDYDHRFAGPGPRHLLGTDRQGQDVLSLLMYGARISLGIAVGVVTIELALGVTLGLIAGYYGGIVDTVLMRFTDVMFAFPDILLAILLVSVVQPAPGQTLPLVVSVATLFFALGMVGWPGMARVVRGQAQALRQKEYVEAARAIGVRDRAILTRHLLPNLLSPIIVQATQDLAAVMLAEATLSFLGLGIPPPYPSWGRLIYEAVRQQFAYPYLLIEPGLALALTVLAFNFLGDALRDALDPRLRQ